MNTANTVDNNDNDWLDLIQAALERGMTKQAIADVVGVNRTYISQAVNKCGPISEGKCSSKHLAQKVRNTLGAFACPFLTEESSQEVRITGLVCRGYAHQEMPTANPREIRHWRACQACPKKAVSALPPHKVGVSVKTAAPGSKPARIAAQAMTVPERRTGLERRAVEPALTPTGMAMVGKATSGSDASDEGWNCVGGPMDNPYPEEDARHDYWAQGFQHRREFDRKHSERLRGKNVNEAQQAGIIDTVTLPLPEVGAPQISKGTLT